MLQYQTTAMNQLTLTHFTMFHLIQRTEHGDFTENYSLTKVNDMSEAREVDILEQSFINFLNAAVNWILRVRKWLVTMVVTR